METLQSNLPYEKINAHKSAFNRRPTRMKVNPCPCQHIHAFFIRQALLFGETFCITYGTPCYLFGTTSHSGHTAPVLLTEH